MSEVSSQIQSRQERLVAMGQMAASLAHEIRNPLGSMELYCTLLKKDLKALPEAFTLAENIHQGIRRLERIIANCLQFSRDVQPKYHSVENIEEYLKETMEIAYPKLSSARCVVTVSHKGPKRVYVDGYLLSQALINIIHNAIDASSEYAKEPHVSIESIVKEGVSWTISVTDNGPGISESDKEKIFDPFFTTKKEGTGLGLAIVHSIVQAHQGSLVIESAIGNESGTTVTIELSQSADMFTKNGQ